MVTESQLSSWTGPSSATEQEKQESTENMIRGAINAHDAFDGFSFTVYTKGSYANNTNVRSDSDVDIVVECQEVEYWEEYDKSQGGHPTGSPYTGIWTPEKLRQEVGAALDGKFPGIIEPGSVAFRINSTTSRVDADVVPAFSYKMYFSGGSSRAGTKVFKTDGSSIVNYSKLQLENGRAKNVRTNHAFKKTVRILKRLENVMVDAGLTEEIPSYLMECLIYVCPDDYFLRPTWRSVLQGCLADIFNYTMKAEPVDQADRWFEVNGAKFLFHSSQKWTRAEVHAFASAAWDYMEFE
ncbi:nucleotidyltransferase [Cryobacterium sp. PAMC25264]|uniref:nucleotidyltransferase domain-containing protein n=1 Tax=Cryobacterium sp. PAMC25264 TaxID=2861288 RepID=UPI001C6262A7|nr:nucleotidyltransferase [Cryobacterium sp. PAMC25264]QYF74428.1 nucleotidyltransferase [Cryobacterium sp. PAMC25264]